MKAIYRFFGILAVGLIVSSCATINPKSDALYSVTEIPESIRKNAVAYAQQYVARDTEYTWGGRDKLEKEGMLGLDCSGLIVRVYQYAVQGTSYLLLFNDTNVSSLHEYFTVPIDTPTPGDFIFMGSEGTYPTHMSIFISMDNDNIYFIDATLKEEDGINGATLRSYPIGDPRFFYYARLLVKYR